MRRSEYNELLEREDEVGMHSMGRALVHLFNRQTFDEKEHTDAKYDNGVGFNSSDARRGTITAKYYIRHKKLEEWQRKYWLQRDAKGRSRLGKYYRQIKEEAEKKRKAG